MRYECPKNAQAAVVIEFQLINLIRLCLSRIYLLCPLVSDSGRIIAAAKREMSSRQQEQLEEAKSAGNEAFKNGSFQEAIKQYTTGIEISGKKNPANAVLFSNRALCHIKVSSCSFAMKAFFPACDLAGYPCNFHCSQFGNLARSLQQFRSLNQ